MNDTPIQKRAPRPTTRFAHFLAGATLALICLLGGAAAQASDPPHWLGAVSQVDCTTNCHQLHHGQGQGLTQAASNVELCQSCHQGVDLPINNADKADPGVSGTSHAFDVAAIHAARGATLPQDTEMALRIMNDNVVCSTCHDQHKAYATNGGRPRVAAATKVVSLGGTGDITSGGTFTGANGVWYLIEIGPQTTNFQYSKDNGTSWFGPQDLGTDVALGDGAGVTISSDAGTFQVGEQWEFSASYPFLRVALGEVGANLCGDCHIDWVMDKTGVNTYDGTYKSHPVGVSLPSASPDFHNPPLDGNGAIQGGAGEDGNPSNDIQIGAGDTVHCLSCHGVHYADSNTLSIDQP